MRRQHRHRMPRVRHRFGFGERDFVGRHFAGRGKAVEHAIARRARDVRRAIGTARLRRLRQRHEQRRFGKRQVFRLLAEIDQRGRANALDIAAIGREIEIEREDLILGQNTLHLDRAHHLLELARQIARVTAFDEARHLHGQGRGAGAQAAAGHELHRGAHHRKRIDAVMRAEALVLVGKQHVEEARIDVGHFGRQAPAAVGRRIGAQKLAVAIEHLLGEFEIFAERRRPERPDPPGRADHHCGASKRRDNERYAKFAARHLPVVTSTFSLLVRPKRSGRYMSSTLACGRTYCPGATARTI